MKIDAVIPWVDGNDPRHRARLNQYSSHGETAQADVGGATRYASVGEIFWCVASINRFAPWINKIYIVSDGQDPGLEPYLEEHFPQGHIPVEIVDHQVIFKGYEEYLPVFNSRAIEAAIWRIPGLSEHFIIFNDDFFITAPVLPEDFFLPDGRCFCYARRLPLWWVRLLRSLKPKKDGRKNVSFKESMMRAAEIVGEKSLILRLEHTPRPLVRSWYENYYASHEDVMLRNISHRFRDSVQYNVQELQYLPRYRQGQIAVRNPFKYLFFIQPKPKKDYIPRKMKKLRRKDWLFCGFNSLDLAPQKDREMLVGYLEEKLGLR